MVGVGCGWVCPSPPVPPSFPSSQVKDTTLVQECANLESTGKITMRVGAAHRLPGRPACLARAFLASSVHRHLSALQERRAPTPGPLPLRAPAGRATAGEAPRTQRPDTALNLAPANPRAIGWGFAPLFAEPAGAERPSRKGNTRPTRLLLPRGLGANPAPYPMCSATPRPHAVEYQPGTAPVLGPLGRR